MKKYKLSIFIFRRDLRLHDNTALIHAQTMSEQVIPVFIFDPRQVEDNPYRSDKCVQFMLESLEDLDKDIRQSGSRLYYCYGHNHEIISQLLQETNAEAVFINKDYTPFSLKRDKEIQETCIKHQADFHAHHDYLLNQPSAVLKKDATPYTVFTPYYKTATTYDITKPKRNNYNNLYAKVIKCAKQNIFSDILKTRSSESAVSGGRRNAKKLLKKIDFNIWNEARSSHITDSSSYLSAHNKFGTLSIRELFLWAKKHGSESREFIRALYWRDFFTQISFHFPHVYGSAFRSKYDNVKWFPNDDYFSAWKEGRTGFPIVDAGMRELNKTGFMQNRVRMITSSFLIKDLHIDWREGEKYFAQTLIDYDPAVNNGNWQWSASTGCDAQPYFRIFNPWRQQLRFDKECDYIKKWIPELKKYSAREIHNIEKQPLSDYPSPIITHSREAKRALRLYKEV